MGGPRPDRWARWGNVKWYVLVVGVSLLVAIPVFVRLTTADAHTDIMHHAELAKGIVEHGGWISYSLWYPLVYVFSGGAQVVRAMRLSSIGLLSLIVAGKSVLVYWAARRALGSTFFAFGISMSLLVIMPLMNPARPTDIYLGQITPNVWHNSTNIFAAPFAIAAFLGGIRLLQVLTVKNAGIFSGLILLATLAKPNYALAFLPVIGIATAVILWRRRAGWPRALSIIAISFVPVVILLICQYVIVYTGTVVTATRPTIDPFAVWSAFSSNIALSIALSLAGPLLVVVSLTSQRRRSLPVVISWAALILAMAEAAVLSEQNPGGGTALDGNWFWGAYTALTVVFLVTFVEFVKLLRSTPRSLERSVLLVIASLALAGHVATGIYYVLNIGAGHYPSY